MVLVPVILMPLIACAHRVPVTRTQGPTLTVTIQLPTGEKQTIGPASIRPTARAAFPGMELPYSGSGAATALSLTETDHNSVAFLLYEGPARPGRPLGLNAIEIGFPTDGPVSRFDVGGSSSPISLPCVSRAAFFIDDVGATPPETVLIWYRAGERETSFKVQTRQHMLRLKPILRFDTRRLAVLAHKTTEYSVVAETSAESQDFLVMGVGRKSDRTLMTTVFPASQRRQAADGFVDHLEWRFYALDDRPHLRSRCRGQ